jgi:hypothetical protein
MDLNLYIPHLPRHLTTTPHSNPFGITCTEIAHLIEVKLAIASVSWVDFQFISPFYAR